MDIVLRYLLQQLQLQILTGGLANYSYKVTCTDDDSTSPLFAKLTFTYALVFPDKKCPLARTQFEYDALMMYHNVLSNSPRSSDTAVTPYFCINVGDDKKLLVTEFSPLDEQAANQFIDGVVDLRVASKLAHSAAALHGVKDVDPNFNSGIAPFCQDLVSLAEEIFFDGFMKKEVDMDRPTSLAQSFGKEMLDQTITKYRKKLEVADCMIHGDCHVFNMLVGAKPSIETLENFSESGDVVIIDWEFSRVGPIGIDVGYMMPFPIAACLTHALNGELSSSESILKFLDTVWDEYLATVSTERELSDVYNSALSFCGIILLVYYNMGYHMEFLPLDDADVEGLTRVKESLGVIGLKFLSWGFGRSDGEVDLTLPELRKMFKVTVTEEMQRLSPIKAVRGRNRRSSMLRASGRRVSDAHYLLSNSVQNMEALMEAEALMM